MDWTYLIDSIKKIGLLYNQNGKTRIRNLEINFPHLPGLEILPCLDDFCFGRHDEWSVVNNVLSERLSCHNENFCKRRSIDTYPITIERKIGHISIREGFPIDFSLSLGHEYHKIPSIWEFQIDFPCTLKPYIIELYR